MREPAHHMEIEEHEEPQHHASFVLPFAPPLLAASRARIQAFISTLTPQTRLTADNYLSFHALLVDPAFYIVPPKDQGKHFLLAVQVLLSALLDQALDIHIRSDIAGFLKNFKLVGHQPAVALDVALAKQFIAASVFVQKSFSFGSPDLGQAVADVFRKFLPLLVPDAALLDFLLEMDENPDRVLAHLNSFVDVSRLGPAELDRVVALSEKVSRPFHPEKVALMSKLFKNRHFQPKSETTMTYVESLGQNAVIGSFESHHEHKHSKTTANAIDVVLCWFRKSSGPFRARALNLLDKIVERGCNKLAEELKNAGGPEKAKVEAVMKIAEGLARSKAAAAHSAQVKNIVERVITVSVLSAKKVDRSKLLSFLQASSEFLKEQFTPFVVGYLKKIQSFYKLKKSLSLDFLAAINFDLFSELGFFYEFWTTLKTALLTPNKSETNEKLLLAYARLAAVDIRRSAGQDQLNKLRQLWALLTSKELASSFTEAVAVSCPETKLFADDSTKTLDNLLGSVEFVLKEEHKVSDWPKAILSALVSASQENFDSLSRSKILAKIAEIKPEETPEKNTLLKSLLILLTSLPKDNQNLTANQLEILSARIDQLLSEKSTENVNLISQLLQLTGTSNLQKLVADFKFEEQKELNDNASFLKAVAASQLIPENQSTLQFRARLVHEINNGTSFGSSTLDLISLCNSELMSLSLEKSTAQSQFNVALKSLNKFTPSTSPLLTELVNSAENLLRSEATVPSDSQMSLALKTFFLLATKFNYFRSDYISKVLGFAKRNKPSFYGEALQLQIAEYEALFAMNLFRENAPEGLADNFLSMINAALRWRAPLNSKDNSILLKIVAGAVASESLDFDKKTELLLSTLMFSAQGGVGDPSLFREEKFRDSKMLAMLAGIFDLRSARENPVDFVSKLPQTLAQLQSAATLQNSFTRMSLGWQLKVAKKIHASVSFKKAAGAGGPGALQRVSPKRPGSVWRQSNDLGIAVDPQFVSHLLNAVQKLLADKDQMTKNNFISALKLIMSKKDSSSQLRDLLVNELHIFADLLRVAKLDQLGPVLEVFNKLIDSDDEEKNELKIFVGLVVIALLHRGYLNKDFYGFVNKFVDFLAHNFTWKNIESLYKISSIISIKYFSKELVESIASHCHTPGKPKQMNCHLLSLFFSLPARYHLTEEQISQIENIKLVDLNTNQNLILLNMTRLLFLGNVNNTAINPLAESPLPTRLRAWILRTFSAIEVRQSNSTEFLVILTQASKLPLSDFSVECLLAILRKVLQFVVEESDQTIKEQLFAALCTNFQPCLNPTQLEHFILEIGKMSANASVWAVKYCAVLLFCLVAVNNSVKVFHLSRFVIQTRRQENFLLNKFAEQKLKEALLTSHPLLTSEFVEAFEQVADSDADWNSYVFLLDCFFSSLRKKSLRLLERYLLQANRSLLSPSTSEVLKKSLKETIGLYSYLKEEGIVLEPVALPLQALESSLEQRKKDFGYFS